MKISSSSLSKVLLIVLAIESLLIAILYFFDPYNYDKGFPYLLLIVSFVIIVILNLYKRYLLNYITTSIIFLIIIILYFIQ